MSAKHGPPKDPQEGYATPGWCCESLLSELPLPGGAWLEPCAGSGNIVRAVRRPDVRWDVCELRKECRGPLVAAGAERVAIGDFLDPGLRASALRPRYDVILTNPPYSKLSEFVNACLPLADLVVMILRLNVLEGAERAGFWRHHAPDVYVLPSRPSFTGKGTDATSYAWFCWQGVAVRSRGHLRVLAAMPASARRG